MPNIFHVNISYFIFHIFQISLYPQIKWKLLYWEGRIKPFLQVSGILMIHDTELKKIPTLPSFLFFFSFVQQTMPFPLFNLFFLYLKERGINDCKNILLVLYGFFFLKIYSCNKSRCFLCWKFWWAAQSRRTEFKLQKMQFKGKSSTAV